MIKLEKISKTYPPQLHALEDASLSILQGEFVAIMGKSGSGKSTLMNIIGFLDKPTTGHMKFFSKDVKTLTQNELANLRLREIGFVFQNFNLLPRLSAWRNVALPMVYAEIPRQKRKEKAFQLLDQVGLADRVLHFPNKLSGGERQRVAIARALANDPNIIIADEPTGNLDSKTGSDIMDMFCQLHQQGKTLIIVTHDASIAAYAQRIINVHDGRIV
ncbi:MAG: ABC transporter ATP-binding protein [Gammaproteobacteria bacterium]|nr:ABC transporter ATP-binding protein [Gammaproteobacteria bacterium]